jgi:hypothetical protein
VRVFLEPQGNFEEAVECVVGPRGILLNDLMPIHTYMDQIPLHVLHF